MTHFCDGCGNVLHKPPYVMHRERVSDEQKRFDTWECYMAWRDGVALDEMKAS